MRVSCISCFRSSPFCTVPGKAMLRARAHSRTVAGSDVKREGRLLGVTRPTRTLCNELLHEFSAWASGSSRKGERRPRQVACSDDVQIALLMLLAARWEFSGRNVTLTCDSSPLSSAEAPMLARLADATLWPQLFFFYFFFLITGVAEHAHTRAEWRAHLATWRNFLFWINSNLPFLLQSTMFLRITSCHPRARARAQNKHLDVDQTSSLQWTSKGFSLNCSHKLIHCFVKRKNSFICPCGAINLFIWAMTWRWVGGINGRGTSHGHHSWC